MTDLDKQISEYDAELAQLSTEKDRVRDKMRELRSKRDLLAAKRSAFEKLSAPERRALGIEGPDDVEVETITSADVGRIDAIGIESAESVQSPQ